MSRLADALQRVDRFLAMAWRWRWKLRGSERRLSEALQTHGEDSFAAASASTEVRRAQFAIEYGRAATPDIQEAVHRAAEAGIPKHVLRLLVINLDVRADSHGRIYVRRSAWLTALAWGSRLVVIAGMALMSLLVLSHPADRPFLKGLLLSIWAAFFAAAAYIWDLFGQRAVRAARAYAEHFEAASSKAAAFDKTVRLTTAGSKADSTGVE